MDANKDFNVNMDLIDLHLDQLGFVKDALVTANRENTPESRATYLRAKNTLGINIRMAFLSYMETNGLEFDIETAVNTTTAAIERSRCMEFKRFTIVDQNPNVISL
jgi:hypothetical protein